LRSAKHFINSIMNSTTPDGSTKRIVVFSGAGVSAESGIRTFRDSGGLWEEYRIEEVATPEAWARDPERVLHFYDMRREQVLEARPNAAHLALATLEQHFLVDVVTQNIDDLHERAGSTKVLHLHGEIRKARSTRDPGLVIPIVGARLAWGAKCALGSQLRPHIVWFGEEVPLLPVAADMVARADVLIVVGTSLQVYPAAGLVLCAPASCRIYVVDPQPMENSLPNAVHIKAPASTGIPIVAEELLRSAGISG
jgi:NAD-dependent deacetylase